MSRSRSTRMGMLALAVAVASLGGSACRGGGGGDDERNGTAATGAAPSSTTASSTAPSSAASAPAAEATTTAASTTVEPATTSTEPPAVTSPLAAVGVAPIEWTGPAGPAGDRPLLSWEGSAGASEYRVVVTDATTLRPIWAWQGTETSVPLGAGLIDGQEGPRLTAPAIVDVFAIGADGTIVAASGPQPITP